MKWVIGIDLGGTNCVVGAVAVDGSRVIGDHSRPTLPKRGEAAVISELIAMAKTTITREPSAATAPTTQFVPPRSIPITHFTRVPASS